MTRIGDPLGACLAGCLVVLSRLPFLSRSYGIDGDAWGVAQAAREIAETGRYVYSRPPGYPVLELACALVHRGGPLASNSLSAIFSGVAAAALYLALRGLAVPAGRAVAAAIALAFVPVVYINSTVTLDYVWALAFICLALWRAIRGAPVGCGIALGLAAGCRITSGALLVPLAILIAAHAPPGLRARRVVFMALVSILVAAACFVPVVMSYGPAFLRFSDEPLSFSDRMELASYGATIGVWGIGGCVALLVGVAGWIARRKPKTEWNRPVGAASLVAILLFAAAYIRLPLEYGYLVPVVPFVILLVVTGCPARWARVALALLLVSPFVGRVDSARRVTLSGPVILDAQTKERQYASLRAVYDEVDRLSDRELVLVAGREGNRFNAVLPHSVTVVRSATASERGRMLREGRTVLMLFKQGPYYTEALRFEPRPGRPPLVTSIPLSISDENPAR